MRVLNNRAYHIPCKFELKYLLIWGNEYDKYLEKHDESHDD